MTHWAITQASWLLWRSCNPTNRPQWRTSRRRSRLSASCTVTSSSNTEASATAQVIRTGHCMALTSQCWRFTHRNDEEKRMIIMQGVLEWGQTQLKKYHHACGASVIAGRLTMSLVMEYLPHGSLIGYLEKSRHMVNTQRLLLFASQICKVRVGDGELKPPMKYGTRTVLIS